MYSKLLPNAFLLGQKACELQIKEIDGRDSGFISDSPTVFLGNLTSDIAVQVTDEFFKAFSNILFISISYAPGDRSRLASGQTYD